MNILVTMPAGAVRDTFITEKSKKELEALGNVTYNPHDRNYTDDELKEALKGIDAVFCCWGSHCYEGEILAAADSLKYICYCAGSLAGVVTEETYEKGITVMGANCVFAESVAESCICYTMAGLRRIVKYANDVRNGGWRGTEFFNEGIMNRTIGLVGFGAIAKKFVNFLKPFNVEILVYSGHLTDEEAASYGVKKASLNELFEKSDVVSIHQGLNDRTYHMVGKEQLDLMKEGALLVNTARGAVVDEPELIKVLQSGKIGAVLDVFEKEPLDADSPLRTLENVISIPHMGGPTIDRRQYCVIKLVEDVKKYEAGERDLETLIPLSHIANMTRAVKK